MITYEIRGTQIRPSFPRVISHQGDHLTQKVRFILPRMYNDVDLYEGFPFVHTQDEAGHRVTSSLEKKKKTKDRIFLEWSVSSEHTGAQGIIEVQISIQGEQSILFSSDVVRAKIGEALFDEPVITQTAEAGASEEPVLARAFATFAAPLALDGEGVDVKEKEPVTLTGRTMAIPEASKKVGVRGDRNAETATFLLDQYYDGQDFAQKNFFVEILNAANGYDICAANAIGSENEKLHIEWLVSPLHTVAAGTLKVRVRVTESNNFIWQSYIGEFTIVDTFDENFVEVEPGLTVIDQALQELAAVRDATDQAKVDAEAARDESRNAKTGAESARDEAEEIANAAASSVTEAQGFATDAQTAKTGAETAQAAAETAKTETEQAAQEARAAADEAIETVGDVADALGGFSFALDPNDLGLNITCTEQ